IASVWRWSPKVHLTDIRFCIVMARSPAPAKEPSRGHACVRRRHARSGWAALMAERIPRKLALQRGLDRYFTGKPCKRNHVTERYSRNGEGVVCARLRVTRWQKTPKGRTYQYEYHQT